MVKVLLDTDIGTDVDDAVCLAYLLAQKQCELLGITTVTGEAEKRASLASVLCKQAGREIPIFPGAEQPMEGEQRQPVCQQAAALPDWPHETSFPQGRAVEFLAETILENQGDVILLTVGPLTNAGMLFSHYPQTAQYLKGLVMMGGNIDPQAENTEWNVSGDLMASEIVYRTPVKLHRSVGLNVTQQVSLTANDVRQKFRADILKPVLDFAEIWFEQFYETIWFHDPLAAATIFEPNLCTYGSGLITFERKDKNGKTVWHPGEDNEPHQAAVSVSKDKYFEHFFGVFH
ncbi:MAG: nucleoside hydrolase [Chloroflexi bacterium]|nr:MAG: nucleoside hydrolase [Chloroflexota bacterium]